MDFIKGFPHTHGHNAILVVVDHLSKYAHFIATKHLYLAAKVADIFLRDVFRLHGMPATIVNDQDPIFISRFWESYKVRARVGKVAYTLDLPPDSCIHPIFHVFLLRPKLGSNVVASTALPPLSDTGLVAWTPKKVVQRGMFKRGNKAIMRWLIK